MKISVEVQRIIVRYIDEKNMSNRGIAKLLKVSPNTVGRIRKILQLSQENWSSLSMLSNDDFIQRLQPHKPKQKDNHRKAVPCWSYIENELKKRDVTLQLLWQEFREQEPDGVSYSQTAKLFKAWQKTVRVSMRQIYHAGEKFFIDFCGKTMDIHDPQTGEVQKAQILVGVFGASSYITAYAVGSQRTADLQRCHIEMFKQVGGVPAQVITDNLKAAVIRRSKGHIYLNAGLMDLAEHYGFAIIPARPYKPKDKSLAEVSVKIIQMGVLARLRNRKFFSLDELNSAIQPLLHDINHKTTKRFQQSRYDRFMSIDAPALQPLPATAFEPFHYIDHVRVSEFYEIEYAGHLYSVPYQYAHQTVSLRITHHTIEVIYERQRIASHLLNNEWGGKTLLDAHLAPHHRQQHDADPERLLAWAAQIGNATHTFSQTLLRDRRDLANSLNAIQKMRRWVNEEGLPEQLENACEYALKINAISLTSLRSIMKTKVYDRHRAEALTASPVITHANLRGSTYFAIQASGVEHVK
ncbi:IS21 family transposase [Acinetobacter pittii]|uniref:IS21 family transposase n=2 Tax=Acinetobacter pittii TaxID=48296 RepID=UPI0003B89F04|nr:IS21 family transposase [Acinetobacter pittii]MBK0408551.1 IS21 family transposase [Acinetobacter pittii]MDQ9816992.1 IS21 family transposase [Acinetobacter pittii]OCY97058.1 hypothetical protein BFR94_10050 [Acinetobacter pittii]OTM17614.1 transposase [Acinetobacter pittii]OTM22922.1 transposase [Acinetobacter pittii]